MINRSILIIPEFENVHLIDELRVKYDPLANHIKPHITVVFPLESNIDSNILYEHISSKLNQIKPFELSLQGITPIYEGKYLFLDIIKDRNELIEIHNKLYRDILKEYLPTWLINNEFYPHMTVGRFNDLIQFEHAVETSKDFNYTFECNIENIYVDIIDEEDYSIIESNFKL